MCASGDLVSLYLYKVGEEVAKISMCEIGHLDVILYIDSK